MENNSILHIGPYSVKSFDVVPKSFIDMVEMNNTNHIAVKLYNIVSNDIEKEDTVDLNLTNSIKNDSYLIVMGGWIPCSFVSNNTLLLSDRNVVSEIIRRYNNGLKKVTEELDSFDNIFLNTNIILDLSPFLIEGNQQILPTNEQMDIQYNTVYHELKLALPKLHIATYQNSYYHQIKNKLSPIIEKRIIFLKKIAPKINKQFTNKTKEKAVKLVFEIAEEMKLEKNDLVILLALLRIVINGNKNPAQLVLKDSQNYSEENAYNAVLDLVTIELLVNYHSFYDDNIYKKAFITRDKGLSLFSSMFNHTEVSDRKNGKLVIKSTIPGEIFDNDEILINLYKKWLNGEI